MSERDKTKEHLKPANKLQRDLFSELTRAGLKSGPARRKTPTIDSKDMATLLAIFQRKHTDVTQIDTARENAVFLSICSKYLFKEHPNDYETITIIVDNQYVDIVVRLIKFYNKWTMQINKFFGVKTSLFSANDDVDRHSVNRLTEVLLNLEEWALISAIISKPRGVGEYENWKANVARKLQKVPKCVRDLENRRGDFRNSNLVPFAVMTQYCKQKYKNEMHKLTNTMGFIETTSRSLKNTYKNQLIDEIQYIVSGIPHQLPACSMTKQKILTSLYGVGSTVITHPAGLLYFQPADFGKMIATLSSMVSTFDRRAPEKLDSDHVSLALDLTSAIVRILSPREDMMNNHRLRIAEYKINDANCVWRYFIETKQLVKKDESTFQTQIVVGPNPVFDFESSDLGAAGSLENRVDRMQELFEESTEKLRSKIIDGYGCAGMLTKRRIEKLEKEKREESEKGASSNAGPPNQDGDGQGGTSSGKERKDEGGKIKKSRQPDPPNSDPDTSKQNNTNQGQNSKPQERSSDDHNTKTTRSKAERERVHKDMMEQLNRAKQIREENKRREEQLEHEKQQQEDQRLEEIRKAEEVRKQQAKQVQRELERTEEEEERTENTSNNQNPTKEPPPEPEPMDVVEEEPIIPGPPPSSPTIQKPERETPQMTVEDINTIKGFTSEHIITTVIKREQLEIVQPDELVGSQEETPYSSPIDSKDDKSVSRRMGTMSFKDTKVTSTKITKTKSLASLVHPSSEEPKPSSSSSTGKRKISFSGLSSDEPPMKAASVYDEEELLKEDETSDLSNIEVRSDLEEKLLETGKIGEDLQSIPLPTQKASGNTGESKATWADESIQEAEWKEHPSNVGDVDDDKKVVVCKAVTTAVFRNGSADSWVHKPLDFYPESCNVDKRQFARIDSKFVTIRFKPRGKRNFIFYNFKKEEVEDILTTSVISTNELQLADMLEYRVAFLAYVIDAIFSVIKKGSLKNANADDIKKTQGQMMGYIAALVEEEEITERSVLELLFLILTVLSNKYSIPSESTTTEEGKTEKTPKPGKTKAKSEDKSKKEKK